MLHPAVQEVVRQHDFIEQWLGGQGATEAGWQVFCGALADRFEMVVPDGAVVRRADLLEGFRSARGARPGVRIEIRNAALLSGGGSDDVGASVAAQTATVRYEEWQLHPTLENQRISTAVFERSEAAPLGWAWLCLHETWLPQQ